MAEPTRYKVGEAPWDKPQEAQPTRYKVGEAPWEKPQEKVINEMHPDIDVGSRLLNKNLAANDDELFNSIQKTYPNLEFKKINDEIVAKRRDEKEYRKLDPSGFPTTLKEAALDVGDALWDLGSGTVESAAAVGAGLAAAPTGPGALLTGAGAGMATGAGLETLRQGLGKQFGVNQDYDKTNIGISGAFGALSPVIMGTGASGKQIAKQAIKQAGKGASEEAVQLAAENIAKSQRGLLSRGKSYVEDAAAPWLGSVVSGDTSKKIKGLSKNLGLVQEYEQGLRENLGQSAEELSSQALKKADDLRQISGQNYAETLAKISSKVKDVDITPFNKSLNSILEKQKKIYAENPNQANAEAVKYVESVMAKYFTADEKGVQKSILKTSGESALKLKDDLNVFTGLKADKELGGAGAVVNEVNAKVRQLAADLDKQIINRAEKQGVPGVTTFKADYAEKKEILDLADKYLGDPKRVERSISTLAKDTPGVDRNALKKLEEKLGINLKEEADLSGLKDFINPAKDVRSIMGATSTSRTIPLTGAGALLGYQLGNEYLGGYGGGLTGSAAGAALGSRVGSRNAIRKVLEMYRGSKNLAAPATKKAEKYLGTSIKGVGRAGNLGANVWKDVYLKNKVEE